MRPRSVRRHLRAHVRRNKQQRPILIDRQENRHAFAQSVVVHVAAPQSEPTRPVRLLRRRRDADATEHRLQLHFEVLEPISRLRQHRHARLPIELTFAIELLVELRIAVITGTDGARHDPVAAYLDSSAWVKRDFQKMGSGWMNRLFEVGTPLGGSTLGSIEVTATFARKRTAGEIDAGRFRQIETAPLDDCDGVFQMELTPDVVERSLALVSAQS